MTVHHDAATEPVLLRSDAGGIATLTLNRPQSRNPLSEAMLAALSDAFAAIARDRSVRAVILAAAGPVFSAGHDLKEMTAHRGDADRGRGYFTEILGRCSAMMQQITALPQPVIAAVEGTATAAGCQLVASCDLAVAGEAARFCTPGVHIGLFCSTPMVALSRNLASKHALEMLLLGEMVPAAEAWRLGLVNRVVPAGGALAEAQRMAAIIASKSPATLKIGKRAFYAQREMGLGAAYDHASAVMVENMLARDAEEGIGAFMDKRAPVWEGEATPPAASTGHRLMHHENYPDSLIREILTSVKRIALVGASANEARPSWIVTKYLLDRGYDVVPVNPGLAGQTLLGKTVYGSLKEIPGQVDMVEIFRNSEAAGPITDEALGLATPPKVIWMQLSVRNDAAAERAEGKGLTVIMNRCPKIEYGRISGEIGWQGINSRILSSKKPVLGKGFQKRTIFGPGR